MENKKIVISLALILLLAAGFRIFGLKERGLYFPDEVRYYKYTKEGCGVLQNAGLKAVLKFAANTFTAKPGHTMLGVIWMNLFGINTHTASMMNVFFGVLTVLLIWITARSFYTERAALAAALLLSLSTLHIYYSRSFMSHIDQIFFIVLAFYLYVLPLAGRRNVIILRLGSGLLLGAAFAVHPTTTIYIAAFFVYELLLLFLDTSRRLRGKLAAMSAFFIGVIAVPLAFLILNKSYFSRLLWVINEARVVVVQRKAEPVPFMLSRVMPAYDGMAAALLAVLASIYFIYRVARYRKSIDLFMLLGSLGIFLYWEFFSVHQEFSRQVLVAVPFFCIIIGVFIDHGVRFKNREPLGVIRVVLIGAVIISAVYSVIGMLANTRNCYGELERFIRDEGPVKIVTPSEYFAGTKELLLPNVTIDVTWLNERQEIIDAIDDGGFDFLIVYPADWLGRPEFRLETAPLFTIKEPQANYFAEFYEGACFNNRLDLLKYRENPLSRSIAVYKIDDALKKEIASPRQ